MSQVTTDVPQVPVPIVLPEVLTLTEAAQYLRVSESEIHDLIAQQGLPGRKSGEGWRFLKAGLQDWLRSPLLQKQRLMELAGAWKDDPYLDEMLKQIYEERGRPMSEDEDG
ncbi:MAG: helix-turn-helix domain-containing protein [Candidatus Paceibacterota bacterium]